MLSKKLLTLDNYRGSRHCESRGGKTKVECIPLSVSHHASECLLGLRLLGALQDLLEQQRILCDPLMWFGLHVPEPHPLTLRMSLYPLDTQKNRRIIYGEPTLVKSKIKSHFSTGEGGGGTGSRNYIQA